MPVKLFKPTSPGRRDMSGYTFEEITRTEPERSLVRGLRNKAGRNMRGKITVRHQGGGHKRLYREIDFKRDKLNVPARVATIESVSYTHLDVYKRQGPAGAPVVPLAGGL